MKHRIVCRGGLAATFLVLGISACGGSSYDRDETIAELIEESGGVLDEATATCVVDGMEAEIGTDRLSDRGNPTDEELAAIETITIDCVLGG